MKLLKVLCFSCLLFGLSFQATAKSKFFNHLLGTYEKMHKSFFDNDLEAVKKNAVAFEKAALQLKNAEATKLINTHKAKFKNLTQAKTLEEGHKDFNVISQVILEIKEKHMPNKTYARYYCPMVRKYWIQNVSESDKVMNPYASKTMPHCGGKME